MKSLLTGLLPRTLACAAMLVATVGFSGCGGGEDAASTDTDAASTDDAGGDEGGETEEGSGTE